MKGLRSLLIVVAVMAGLCAMAAGVSDKNLSEKQLRKYNALYLEAVCQREAGNYVAQYRLLERAIKINPNGSEALFDMGQMGVEMSIDIPVVEYFRRAHALQPRNEEYSYELATVLLAMDDPEGVDLMMVLLESADKRDEAYAQLCAYYEMQRDYDRLAEILERWRPVKADDEFISFHKMQSAVALGHNEEALQIADTLLARYPQNASNYKYIKADALLNLGRGDEVLALINQIQQETDDLSDLHLLRYKYANSTKDKAMENQALQDMVLDADVPMQTRISAFQTYVQGLPVTERSASRDSLVNRLLDINDTNPVLLRIITEQMQNENVPDSLMIPIYNKLLEINPSDELTRLHLMQNCLVEEDYDELAKLSTDGLKENPKHPLFYYFAGVRLQIQKDDSAAVEMFARGLPYIDEGTHTQLVSSYYSSYADALYKMDRKPEAYAMYDTALVYNADNLMCLNNYAYFLSLENTQLDKAERMSKKTVQLEPENATYLDTYAWICFLRNDYNNARKYVDLTIKYTEDPEDPENATLYEHAGDIYYHLGLTDKAVDFWKHALRLDDSVELVRKKLNARKYIKE